MSLNWNRGLIRFHSPCVSSSLYVYSVLSTQLMDSVADLESGPLHNLLGPLQNEMRDPLFKKEEKSSTKCELKYKAFLYSEASSLFCLSLSISTCIVLYVWYFISFLRYGDTQRTVQALIGTEGPTAATLRPQLSFPSVPYTRWQHHAHWR